MTAASSSLPAPHLMPLMRYRDLAEAMAWLERAFGFEKQIAVSDNDGAVIYGQMTYRGSLMMMGAVRETDLDKLMRQPDEVGGVETQSCYVVVDDADEHYARALDAGAEIMLDIKSDGLGRRGYSCRDPQGHIWNFGTYNPGKGLSPVAVADADDDEAALPHDLPPRRSRASMMAAALLVAIGIGTWWVSDTIKTDLAHHLAHEQAVKAEAAYAELAKVRAEKRASDALAVQLHADLEAERAQRQAATADAVQAQTEEAQRELADMRAGREKAEAEARALRDELKRRQAALDAANEAKRISEEKLAVKTAEEAHLRDAARKQEAVAAELRAQQSRLREEARRDTPPAEAVIGAAEAPPPGSKKLETSATTTVTNPASKPDARKPVTTARVEDDDDDVAKPAKRSVKRAKAKRSIARREEPPPTYVINLHSVPWPYSTWYK